jgi:hypothetical protein
MQNKLCIFCYNYKINHMNNQKILNIIITLVVLIMGYFIYVFFGSKQVEIQNIKDNASLTETSLRLAEGYVPLKFEDKGKTLWKGLGFEPGFILEIKEGVVKDYGFGLAKEYPTRITFQENSEVEGVLLKHNNESPEYIARFTGNLLVGGDAAVSTEIKIIKKMCVKPSEDKTDFTVNVKYSEMNYNGCIEMIK